MAPGSSIGDVIQQQASKVPLVGGPNDGNFTAPAPDDGQPHCAMFHAPLEQQDALPLHLVVYFYRWNASKRQWDFFSIERVRSGDKLKERMMEINGKGSHA
jgi:hypothetical protein